MRISILGTGYVGMVTGLCLAEMGNEVTCIDIVPEKVKEINEGKVPLYEPGLEELLRRNIAMDRFMASSEVEGIASTAVTFICIGTPSREDGSLDITQLLEAVGEVGGVLTQKEGDHLVVIKSTVPPTTTAEKVVPALEVSSGRKVGAEIGVAVNPEFLREGSAVHDFMHPDRIVIGAWEERDVSTLCTLYADLGCPIVRVDPTTAEMIKMASNAFLATKISFINEVGNLCKLIGVNVGRVAEGMGLDRRIGPHFLRAGCGFGGSCFPKDVRGLIAEAKKRGADTDIMEAVLRVNDRQPLRMVELLESRMGIAGRRIGVLGLAFKPGTDDVRESRAIPVIRELLKRGASVACHDPRAMDNFRVEFPEIEYCGSAAECVERSDAVLIVTEWEEYGDASLFKDKLVVDGRGVVRTPNYEGICW